MNINLPSHQHAIGLRLVLLTSLAALAAALALSAGRASAATTSTPNPGLGAHSARVVSLTESSTMKATRHSEDTLSEQGTAVGTYRGLVLARIIIDLKHFEIRAAILVRTREGLIRGHAHADFVLKNGYAFYRGTMTLAHGSGRFAHASGNLEVSGWIKRSEPYGGVVKVKGQMRI